MASKLSFDIDINNQGFVRGMQESSKATQDVKKATEEYLQDFGSLRKQLAGAKKDAQNLAVQFAMLGEAEKNSEYGKELAENLQLAIEKAAELQDVMADTNDAIKNAASDTAGLDALKEVFDIGKEAATAYIGVLGRLTGSEKELKNVVSSLIAVQGAFNTVQKVTNQLQKNSATMIALQRAGVLSLARAEQISAAAARTSALAVRGLGLALKSVPFIGIAAAVLALGKAFIEFAIGANKVSKSQESVKKELTGTQRVIKQVADTFNRNYATALSKTLTLYKQLQSQYKKLSTDHQKTEWIKQNADKFKELGLSVNTVNDADKVLIKQSADVIQAFKLRAQEAAEAARLQDLYTQRILAETEARKKAGQNNFKAGQQVAEGDVSRYGLQEGIDYKKYNNKVGLFYTDAGAMKAMTASAARNIQTYTKDIDAEIEESANRLAKAEEDYNKQLGNLGVAPSGSTDKAHNIKIKVNPELDWGNWSKALDNQFKEFDKNLKDKLKTFSDKYNTETTKIKVNLDAQLSSPQNIQRALNEISEALKIEPKLDFEIPENMREQIDSQKEQSGGLLDALAIAEERKIDFAKAGDLDGIAAMNEQIQNLTEAYDENTEALDKNIKKAKRIASISEAFNQAGQAVGAFGDMFTALGEATDNAGLKVMGIIAQAIATIALSFAQALSSCKTWVDWLIFGVTGMATMITMISQIKNLTAGGYAEGGVVPGTSFTGDKLLARVNSGERILTAQQNENLEKIANANYSGYQQINSQSIQVVGKIKGTDILLVSKNTNKILNKSGSNITIH